MVAAPRRPALPPDGRRLDDRCARSGYLGDGKESSNLTADFEIVPNGPNEQWTAASADDSRARATIPAATGTSPPPDPDGSAAGRRRRRRLGTTITVSGNLGPPVDLWDTDWPKSGYYWTVIPVAAVGLGLAGTFVAPPGAPKGATTIPVTTTTGFRVGDAITIGVAPNSDSVTITGVGGRHDHARRKPLDVRAQRRRPVSTAPAGRSSTRTWSCRRTSARPAASSASASQSEPSLTSARRRSRPASRRPAA